MTDNNSSIFPWQKPQPPTRPSPYPISSPIDVIDVDVSTPSSVPSSAPDRPPANDSYAANIGLIGPRASGKSYYASALAAWNHQTQKEDTCPVNTVLPFGDSTKQLAQEFMNTVLHKKGKSADNYAMLGPTPPRDPNLVTQPTYNVKVTFNPPNPEKLEISYQDFAGELYSGIEQFAETEKNLVKSYINDLIIKDGLIFFVDGTARHRDNEYRQSFDQFMTEWLKKTAKPCRMAIVVGKCDHAELWARRYDPQIILSQRFDSLCKSIQMWSQQEKKLEVAYFATSVLGTLGNSSWRQPNTQEIGQNQDGNQSEISDGSFWRPFGLISPLYWMATGRMPPIVTGAVEPW